MSNLCGVGDLIFAGFLAAAYVLFRGREGGRESEEGGGREGEGGNAWHYLHRAFQYERPSDRTILLWRMRDERCVDKADWQKLDTHSGHFMVSSISHIGKTCTNIFQLKVK